MIQYLPNLKNKKKKIYTCNIAGFLTIFATTQISIAKCVRSIFKMFRGMRYFFERFKNCFNCRFLACTPSSCTSSSQTL